MGKNISKQKFTCRFSSRPSQVKPSPSMLSQLTPSKTSRLRSKTKKVSHLISKDLSSLESNLRMEELSLTTTSKRSQLSISSLDLEEVCKSSSRPLLERPSLLMLSQQTQLKMLRPRSKIRKVSHQISKDLSSLVSNSRTEELSPITTSKKSPLSTWSLDLEEVCKSSSRPLQVRPSPSMSSQLIQLRTSRPRSKTKKVSHQTSTLIFAGKQLED